MLEPTFPRAPSELKAEIVYIRASWACHNGSDTHHIIYIPPTNMSGLRIAIIGAGPAGLVLARLLQIENIPCTIFELDTGPNERDQGGTVDLHGQGGQLVLREAGLIDEFNKHSRPEGEAMKLVKYDGTVLFDENHEGNARPAEFRDRPEIDRAALRQILLGSIKPGTVVWNKKLVTVESTPNGNAKYNLSFSDGAVETGFDLVIGADGAWSKVRGLLTDQQPFYSGISGIELWALDVEKRKPFLSQYVGKGTMFMFDEGRAIICQRNGNDSIRTYAAVRQPETWIKECGIDWSKGDEARKQVLDQYFTNCSDDLKRLVLESDDKLTARSMWMLPINMKWEPRPGVTVVGDAAHLMTPFAGVGVNLAMVDSWKLSKAIIGSGGDLEKLTAAMKDFEAEMFERGRKFAQKTWKGLQSHFSATGGEERAALMKGRMAATH